MFSAVWYRFGKDGISVKIKYNKEVIIAAGGLYENSTCLICAYFSNDGFPTNVSVMSTQTWCFFYDNKNEGKDLASMFVIVLLLDITSYDSLFLTMI